MRGARLFLTGSGMVLLAHLAAQHSPLTSQYLFNGLLINPAYAGSRDALAANLTHRQQWVGFDGAPVTQTLSIHSPLKGRRVGLGLLVYHDRIGVSNETGVFTNYAYRIRFRRSTLAFGAGAGITLAQGRWSSVALHEQQDAVFAGDTRGNVRPNFSGGLFYYSRNYFIGASVPFLMARRFDPVRNAWVATTDLSHLQPMLTGGYIWKLSNDLRLKPSTLIRYQAASNIQADLSCNLIVQERFWIGASYRTMDAVVCMVEVLPTPQWRLGYAYDLGVDRMARHHAGSHELMIQYELGYRVRVRDPRYF